MRRLAFAIAAVWLLVASIATLTATTREANPPMRYGCGAKLVDIYFWPHGHPAIPRLGFPKYAPPHAEFYRGHVYTQPGFLAFASGGGTSVQCPGVKEVLAAVGAGATKTTKTTKVRCKLSKGAELHTTGAVGFGEMVLVAGHGNIGVAAVSFTPQGSSLAYQKRSCKPVGLYK